MTLELSDEELEQLEQRDLTASDFHQLVEAYKAMRKRAFEAEALLWELLTRKES